MKFKNMQIKNEKEFNFFTNFTQNLLIKQQYCNNK
jgi:hypothetical protein